MLRYRVERSLLPAMWPDGGERPETHDAVVDPLTGKWAWVVQHQVQRWLKRRRRLAAKEG